MFKIQVGDNYGCSNGCGGKHDECGCGGGGGERSAWGGWGWGSLRVSGMLESSEALGYGEMGLSVGMVGWGSDRAFVTESIVPVQEPRSPPLDGS